MSIPVDWKVGKADCLKNQNLVEKLREGPLLADGAIGSYLFTLTGRLSELRHVYECFNSDEPDLVKRVHISYLRAGAQCLTTNTFGANRAVLAQYGEETRVGDLNRNGVRLARESVERFQQTQDPEIEILILGSVGPPPAGFRLENRTGETYSEQLDGLIEQSVDALLLETFTSLSDLQRVIDYIRRHYPEAPPVIAEMAVRRETESGFWNFEPVAFIEAMHQSGIEIAGVNCCAPWDAVSFIDQVESLPAVKNREILLSVMPNGGGFQRIGNRYMTQVNPEYLGRLSRTLVDRGVRLVGGCCEVHPAHIREMFGYMQSRRASRSSVSFLPEREWEPAGHREKSANGPFTSKLLSGEFAVSVEILPPRGTSEKVICRKYDFIRELAASGLADALDITDGSRGIPLVPPVDFISLIRREMGWDRDGRDELELIPHFTCRDLNVMGLQSRLIGFHVQKIHNVLFITGDPPKMSPSYPRSTAVFDLNSVDLIRLTHSFLNAGVDFGGRPLSREGDPRTHFTIGTGFEPESLDRNEEIEKLKRKIDAGAEYIMTQPVFRPNALDLLEKFRGRVWILPGVMVLQGLEHARRIAEVPGVVIPESVFRRFERFASRQDQVKAGIDLAAEQIQEIRRFGWDGLYLMSPASAKGALEALAAAAG